MRKLSFALALASLLTASAARAEPVSVSLQSSTGGFEQTDPWSFGWFAVDLGTIELTPGSTGTYLIDGLRHGTDYSVSLVADISGVSTIRAEVFDPAGGFDDRFDPDDQSASPEGYSTSSKIDGFSFAQDSGLERSATFAGGSADILADETTHRGDVLMFSGLSGVDGDLDVTFGLRDRIGDRPFLVRLTAEGDLTTAPEPASMLLIGTGLAGLAAARRRRGRQAGSRG